MDDLHGRNAFLTGAAGGLGAFIGRALADEGVNVALADRRKGDTTALAKELERRGVRTAQLGADLSKPRGRRELVARAEDAIGPLDILVNNAGLEFGGPFADSGPEELELITAVNLTAVMELTRQALPGMLERHSGHIVNIASMAGKLPAPHLASYAATKHGVVGFTHALRSEMGSKPVGFSAICPTFITRAGMYARIEHLIDDPPPDSATKPPEAVGDAVISAIREDRAEVRVMSGPSGALTALYAANPSFVTRLIGSRRPSLAEARRLAEERRRIDT